MPPMSRSGSSIAAKWPPRSNSVHVREEVVAVDGVFRPVDGVHPLLELLGDPGELADRGVGECVGEGLRPRRLEVGIPLLLAAPRLHPFPGGTGALPLRGAEGSEFFVGRLSRRSGAGDHVQVDADDLVGADAAELAGDGPPVATLDAVTVVAQAAHHLGEGARDALALPALLTGWAGEPEAGEARQDQMDGVRRVAAVRPGVGERAGDVLESTMEPGQPCVMIRGVASGSGERMCARWMSAPSIVVMNWGHWFRRASAARQSYSCRQWCASSRR